MLANSMFMDLKEWLLLRESYKKICHQKKLRVPETGG